MRRVSTNQSSIDQRYYMNLQEWRMNQLQNKMSSQSRIKELRDDPLSAGHSTRYQSQITRMRRYSTNIERARGNLALMEGNIHSTVDILQRVRELSVQGANGIYNKQQLTYMAEEVNQLLNEMVKIANARSTEGTTLFSGFMTQIEPFRVHTAKVPGSKGEVISRLDYIGNIGLNMVEISERATMPYGIPGNYAFWAENQQIYSSTEALEYRVQQDSKIRLDGVDISLKEGDNVFAVISKINDSTAPLRARIDPVNNSLVLETTFAHQIWAEDIGGGSVLKDLGIISPGGERSNVPPLNFSDSAMVSGGSIFDMVIYLRDRFYAGDSEAAGGRALKGIDLAINSLTTTLAEVGARDNRLQVTMDKLSYELPEFIKRNSEEVDLDLSEAIMELKMLEYTHKAALGTAARILKPTLLDFLR
ncbi:MAG TPA: flagellar hook-associated protein 3 [Spirochaetales bacterium]|nr:flagellar hook-associated protein 3 [Spirochaetales bacterium]